jgi:phage FluMu protein Com
MPPPTCSFCGATLRNVAFSEAQCPQCGAKNRFDAKHDATDQKLYRENVGTWYSRLVRGLGFVFAAMFLGFLLYFLREMEYKIRPKVYEEAPPPTYRAADLHELGDPVTEISPIDPSGLGSLTALDPLAHLLWFENLARTWSPDARLVALELHGVRVLGTLDVGSPASDPYVRYQFASKARAVVAKKLAKANASLAWSAIDLVLKRGLLKASVVTNASEDRDSTPVTFACGIPQLVDMWRSRGMSSKEAYNLELDDVRGPKQDLVWESKDDHLTPIGIDCHFRP